MEKTEHPRPHGTIKVWETGHAFFPENIRGELGIEADLRVPYYINSETVLLTRKKMTIDELLAELDALKLIIIRRAGRIQDDENVRTDQTHSRGMK